MAGLLPRPRTAMLLWRGLANSTFVLGSCAFRSSSRYCPDCSNAAPLSAAIGMGTLCASSSRRRALTITSSSRPFAASESESPSRLLFWAASISGCGSVGDAAISADEVGEAAHSSAATVTETTYTGTAAAADFNSIKCSLPGAGLALVAVRLGERSNSVGRIAVTVRSANNLITASYMSARDESPPHKLISTACGEHMAFVYSSFNRAMQSGLLKRVVFHMTSIKSAPVAAYNTYALFGGADRKTPDRHGRR